MSRSEVVQQQPQQGMCGIQEQILKRLEAFKRQLAIDREANDRWYAEMKEFINGISVRAGNASNHGGNMSSPSQIAFSVCEVGKVTRHGFGVENPPLVDAPQLFEKSPKGSIQIRLDVGASSIVNPLADLMKLKQLETVEQYRKSFEALLSEVDLPVGEVVSCFLGGLREEIQSVVRTFKPKTLYAAICLAKLQEATLASIARGARSSATIHSSHMNNTCSQSKTVPHIGLAPQVASSNEPGNIAEGSIVRKVEKTQPQEVAIDADKGVEDSVQVDAKEGRMEALPHEENEGNSEDGPMGDENSQVHVSAFADLKSSFRVAQSEMRGNEEFLVPVKNLKAFAVVCGEKNAADTEQEKVSVNPKMQDEHTQLNGSHHGQGVNLTLGGSMLFFRGEQKCWYHGWKEANGFCLFVFDPGKLRAGQSTPQPKSLVFMCAWLVKALAVFKLSVLKLVFDPGEKIFVYRVERPQSSRNYPDLLEGELLYLKEIGELEFGEDWRFEPSKLLAKFQKEAAMVNSSYGSRRGIGFAHRKPKLALVFVDLAVDPYQILTAGVALALQDIGYSIEIFSHEDGPAHSVYGSSSEAFIAAPGNSLIVAVMNKMSRIFDPPLGKEKQGELQALLCDVLQVIIQKLSNCDETRHIVFQVADQIMVLFLKILTCCSSTVHEEAMFSMGALAYATGSDFGKYMPEFYKNLDAGVARGWFTAHVSSCGPFRNTYHSAPESVNSELRTMDSQLCQDDMPMVKRSVASNLAKLAATVETAHLHAKILSMLEDLSQDDHDSVRLLAGECCAAVGKLLEPQNCIAHMLPVSHIHDLEFVRVVFDPGGEFSAMAAEFLKLEGKLLEGRALDTEMR